MGENDITKSNLSDSLLDNYDSLIENLISSSSPDEMLQKMVTNEIPETFPGKLFDNTLVDVSKPVVKDKVSIPASTADGSKPIESQEESSAPAPAVIIPIKQKPVKIHFVESCPQVPSSSGKRSSSGFEANKSKKLKKEEKDVDDEDVEFENIVNEKVYRIMLARQNASGLKKVEVSDKDVKYSLTAPKYVSSATTANEVKESKKAFEYFKIPSPTKWGIKKYTKKDKYYNQWYLNIRDEWDQCSSSEDKIKRYKTSLRCKRGSLKHQLRMELDNFTNFDTRKLSQQRVKEEETEVKSEELDGDLKSDLEPESDQDNLAEGLGKVEKKVLERNMKKETK